MEKPIVCMTCKTKLKSKVPGLSGVFPCPKCHSMVLVRDEPEEEVEENLLSLVDEEYHLESRPAPVVVAKPKREPTPIPQILSPAAQRMQEDSDMLVFVLFCIGLLVLSIPFHFFYSLIGGASFGDATWYTFTTVMDTIGAAGVLLPFLSIIFLVAFVLVGEIFGPLILGIFSIFFGRK